MRRSKPGDHGLDAGSVIRELREERGLSQAQLAAKIGATWNRSRICKVESGDMKVTKSAIHLFADAFNMRPEKLFFLCLRSQYPALETGKVGDALQQLVDLLEGEKIDVGAI